MMKSMRVGGKLRRLRQERHLTQAQMAAELDISPSYLNLIESNQRPVTASVLLRLASKFQIEIGNLSSRDDDRLTSELMEALSDPLFDEHDVKANDVRDLITTLPSIANTFLALYRSHHSMRARAGNDAVDGAVMDDSMLATLPSEEVSAFIQQKMNYFPDLEKAASALWIEEGLGVHTLSYDLSRVLSQRYAVRMEIVPAEQMPGLLRHYDVMKRRLELSEMLPPASRTFQMAHQIALLSHRNLIDYLSAGGKFTSVESDALARSALANYFAAALMMPYQSFVEAAKSTRYDLDVLQSRFGASFEQICHRLTTLRQPGNSGIPFHLLRVDIAGNISKRFSASGIQIARFGAACPKWNVYDAFTTPGMMRLQVSRMPDGQTFFCIARTIGAVGGGAARGRLTQPVDRRAIALGCAIRHARDIVYSDGLHLDDEQLVTAIGVSCPACPRTNCAERATPALAQKLEIDENRRGYSPYMTC
jgi:predicted transcriptional regulator/transcriptional regulator with XRE-family HTH domain